MVKGSDSKDSIVTMDDLMSKVKKEYGEGLLVSEKFFSEVERIPSSILSYNVITGGGLPIGRHVEYYGPESSGKTTLAIHNLVDAQKHFPNKAVGIIDYEQSFDALYARNLGLDTSPSRWAISQPDNAEQGVDILELMISSNLFSVIVVDSVAAMTPKAEIEGNMEDASMGLHARIMSKTLRKLTALANKSKTSVIWINQLRDKIGVMFGNPETTTGGNALKFYCSIRIDVRKSISKNNQTVSDGEVVGNKITMKVVKNKVAPPFRVSEMAIKYGKGIDKYADLLNVCMDIGYIKQSGAWFSLTDEDGTKLGQGRESTISLIEDNEELYNKLYEECQKTLAESTY